MLLLSHDANILYLQRLLNLNWMPESFSQNVADPGGLLAFDVWKQSAVAEGNDDAYFVSVSISPWHSWFSITLCTWRGVVIGIDSL